MVPKALRTLTLTPCTLPTGATLPRALTWKLLLSSPAGLAARQVYKPESATYTKPGEGKNEAKTRQKESAGGEGEEEPPPPRC